jgi:hypothetical protein
MTRWISFLFIYIIIDWYAFQAVKTISKNPWLHYIHIGISVLVVGNFILQFVISNDTGRVLSPAKSYAFGFLLTLMALKLSVLPFLFGEDLYRLGAGFYHKYFGAKEVFVMPSR